MNTNTTIYGYVGDGWVAHPACVDDGADLHVEGKVTALFNWDDDGYGLSCDTCGEYIFEPYDSDDGEDGFYEPEQADVDNMLYRDQSPTNRRSEES